jgi:hypothetical protein
LGEGLDAKKEASSMFKFGEVGDVFRPKPFLFSSVGYGHALHFHLVEECVLVERAHV